LHEQKKAEEVTIHEMRAAQASAGRSIRRLTRRFLTRH
jgi:hypothetical protein